MKYHDYRIIGENDKYIREKCARTGRTITVRKKDLENTRKNRGSIRDYMTQHGRDFLQPVNPDFVREYGQPKK